jgi:hypothetical protein
MIDGGKTIAQSFSYLLLKSGWMSIINYYLTITWALVFDIKEYIKG